MPKKPKVPRRNAKQERSLASIDAIVDAAAQVLLQRGYAHATTNHIAQRAGVSIGTLYQYFPNKDAIFERILDREEKRLLAFVMQQQPVKAESLGEKLHRLFQQSIQLQRYGPELFRVLEQVPNALLRKRLKKLNEVLVLLARELLRQHEDDLTVDDPDLAAWILIHAAQSLAYEAPPQLFRGRLAKEMSTLFTRYLTG